MIPSLRGVASPCALVALLVSCPLAVAAQPRPTASLRVERSADEACPDAASLRAEVERTIGRPFVADDAPLALVVQYRPPRGGSRRALVTVRDGAAAPRVRELAQPGPGCGALAEAVALAVALLVDPDAAVHASPPTTQAVAPVCPAVLAEPCPGCAVCPPPMEATPPPPPPTRAVRPPWFSLAAGLSFGLTPATPAASVGLTANLPIVGPWSLDLGASITPATTTADGVVSVGRSAARVGACLDTAPTWAQFGGCAGVMAGALHLATLALQPVQPGDRAWLGAAAEVHARALPARRWLVAAYARAEVPILTAAPRVEGVAAPSFSPWPVAIELGLAVGATLR